MSSLKCSTLLFIALSPVLGADPLCSGASAVTESSVIGQWKTRSQHASGSQVVGAVPTDCTGGSASFGWFYQSDTANPTLVVKCQTDPAKCCKDTVGVLKFTGEGVGGNRSDKDAAVWTAC